MATQWNCRSCHYVFETRGRRDSHHRLVHQGLANTTMEASKRREDGRVECICGRRYQRVQELKRHQKACDIATNILEVQLVEEDGTYSNYHIINISTPSG